MNYLELLKHSYEVEKSEGGCPESPLEYLGEYIFQFTTYDGEMSVLFARKAVEVCAAITNRTTFDYHGAVIVLGGHIPIPIFGCEKWGRVRRCHDLPFGNGARIFSERKGEGRRVTGLNRKH